MSRGRTAKAFLGLCALLIGNAARAESSPFVGRWHWNAAQSTLPPGAAGADDVMADVNRLDGARVSWSFTVSSGQRAKRVETFEAVADGEFHPINSDTMVAFHLMGNALQATFKRPTGQTDSQTCTLSADQQRMTCRGVLNSGDGGVTSYVDVYDRM